VVWLLMWADGKVSFYFILWLYEDIFIESHVEKYILKYSFECIEICIRLIIEFLYDSAPIMWKIWDVTFGIRSVRP